MRNEMNEYALRQRKANAATASMQAARMSGSLVSKATAEKAMSIFMKEVLDKIKNISDKYNANLVSCGLSQEDAISALNEISDTIIKELDEDTIINNFESDMIEEVEDVK